MDKTKPKEGGYQGIAKTFVRRRTMKRLWPVCMVFAVLVLTVGAQAVLAQSDPTSVSLQVFPIQMQDGYYVGPVGASVGGGALQPLVCDDFTDRAGIPSTFNAYVSTIPALQNAEFAGQSNAVFQYEEAAWLMYEMELPANNAQVGNIQYAIWSLFDPSTPTQGAGETTWLTEAAAINPAAWNFSGVSIYTPIPEGSSQEFMGGSISPVPEPTSLLLLAFGLMGIAPMRRLAKK